MKREVCTLCGGSMRASAAVVHEGDGFQVRKTFACPCCSGSAGELTLRNLLEIGRAAHEDGKPAPTVRLGSLEFELRANELRPRPLRKTKPRDLVAQVVAS